MSFKERLRDLDREVGRISMFLQCGDFHGKDLARELTNTRDCVSDLSDMIEQTEETLDDVGEECVKVQYLCAELGHMEDAMQALGLAEDSLVELVTDPFNRQLAMEVVSQLDSACNAVTRAAEV